VARNFAQIAAIGANVSVGADVHPEIALKHSRRIPGIEFVERQRFEFLESFRNLRSSLIFMGNPQTRPKTILITSSVPKEGKSTVSLYLAATMAMGNSRVLLIDADMRRPRQHELFKVNDTLGLSALLTGRAGKETARRIHPELRLFVIAAGVLPPNPQELLTRPAFEVVLNKFAAQFDVIIIDTPPSQASADAQVIAAKAGSALVLARRNHTTESALRPTVQSLLDSKVTVVGSVINEYG